MSEIATGPLTTLAFCWRIERPDGAGLGFTSHDSPIAHDGQRFLPAPGMLPSAIVRALGLEPHSGEVAGVLTSEALTEVDLQLGRWDGARVSLFAVDWENPEAGEIVMLRGELGEVALSSDGFTAEMHGAAVKLNRPVCPSTAPECRAELGDKQCRVDLSGRLTAGCVIASSGTSLTLDFPAEERFRFGRLRYLSGANCGIATTVLAVSGSIVTVRDLPRSGVENGTRVEIREGCDKRFVTCAERFGNAANFRGEPHLPGNDLLTRYPGA